MRRGKGVREVLPRAFYARPTLVVAQELLGKVLVHRTAGSETSGMIVETEAYIGEDDPACHAAPGPTKRNEPLYGEPGVAYVYLNYGIHYLVNAVTEEGRPAAVLLRALEPIDGILSMVKRRSSNGRRIDVADLCRGPGNLTKALGITIAENRLDLTRAGQLYIEDRGFHPHAISRGPRIGIAVGVRRPWRFWITGNGSVSATPRQA